MVLLQVVNGAPLPNLQCLHAPPLGPPVASCFALRNTMSKAPHTQTFGRDDAIVDVLLPYTFVSGIVMPVRRYSLNWTADDCM